MLYPEVKLQAIQHELGRLARRGSSLDIPEQVNGPQCPYGYREAETSCVASRRIGGQNRTLCGATSGYVGERADLRLLGLKL